MALDLGPNPGLCDELAQQYGGLVPSSGGCVPVSGKVIKIEEDEYSLMEGFEIDNFNWHAFGNKPAAATPEQMPGPVEGKNNLA